MSKTKVIIKSCEEYHAGKVKRNIGDIIDSLGGISRYIKRGDRVLLKPNLLQNKPVEKAVTTHPLIIRAVAEIVKDAGGEVIVGDSPGIGSALSIAEKSGLTPFIERLGGKIVNFEERIEVKTPEHFVFKRFEIAKAVTESDLIINLPKIKTHAQMYLTLAVKNLFGCVVGKRKVQWHFMAGRDVDYFATMLVELHQMVNSRLTIVDGITAMEGNGPGSGTPRDIGILLGGEDCVAIDRVICEILGAKPANLRTLVMAEKLAIGEPRLENISLDGDPLDSVRVNDFKMANSVPLETMGLPGFLGRYFKNAFTSKPAIDNSRCTLCLTCLDSCPVEVISRKKGKSDALKIDSRNCIRCFCCQELCPDSAINVKKGWCLRIADLIR
jgi:uncharacterized protein (DUF362 family)/NAD-dependent dihydropyrimidine dehydrogenase PreA subunit